MASLRLGVVGDERLAQLVALGDETAFRLLYDRYHQRLYRYCRSLLHHEADAQDALQSTFTSAFTALQSGRRDAPMRPWLFRIAHNESISLVRRRPPEQELTDVLEPATTSLEERVDERQRLSLLVADLHELPERQRGALVMRELSGLSHEEVALALATSINAAKQTIFEARKSLTEFAEGRVMACDDVCRLLSDADGRVLRSRRVRAHLRHCSGCAAFAAAIPERGTQLRALAPPLPAVAAGGILARVLGGSSHGGGTGLLAGAGKGAGSAVAAKATAVAVAATTAVGITAAVKLVPSVHSASAAHPRPALQSRGQAASRAASGRLPAGIRVGGASAVGVLKRPARPTRLRARALGKGVAAAGIAAGVPNRAAATSLTPVGSGHRSAGTGSHGTAKSHGAAGRHGAAGSHGAANSHGAAGSHGAANSHGAAASHGTRGGSSSAQRSTRSRAHSPGAQTPRGASSTTAGNRSRTSRGAAGSAAQAANGQAKRVATRRSTASRTPQATDSGSSNRQISRPPVNP